MVVRPCVCDITFTGWGQLRFAHLPSSRRQKGGLRTRGIMESLMG